MRTYRVLLFALGFVLAFSYPLLPQAKAGLNKSLVEWKISSFRQTAFLVITTDDEVISLRERPLALWIDFLQGPLLVPFQKEFADSPLKEAREALAASSLGGIPAEKLLALREAVEAMAGVFAGMEGQERMKGLEKFKEIFEGLGGREKTEEFLENLGVLPFDHESLQPKKSLRPKSGLAEKGERRFFPLSDDEIKGTSSRLNGKGNPLADRENSETEGEEASKDPADALFERVETVMERKSKPSFVPSDTALGPLPKDAQTPECDRACQQSSEVGGMVFVTFRFGGGSGVSVQVSASAKASPAKVGGTYDTKTGEVTPGVSKPAEPAHSPSNPPAPAPAPAPAPTPEPAPAPEPAPPPETLPSDEGGTPEGAKKLMGSRLTGKPSPEEAMKRVEPYVNPSESSGADAGLLLPAAGTRSFVTRCRRETETRGRPADGGQSCVLGIPVTFGIKNPGFGRTDPPR